MLAPALSTTVLGSEGQLGLLLDSTAKLAISLIFVLYVVAAAINLYIPKVAIDHKLPKRTLLFVLQDFWHSFRLLWRDPLGQVSLAVTTLFWGAGATLQFIVLKWAEKSLNMPLDKAAILQGIFAVGVAVGATAAARFVPLKKALTVMPLGVGMGMIVTTMTMVNSVWLAYPLLVLIGALAGYFVVPMNALLQHRGHVLLSAGHSIAVQNFNENLSVLTMLMLYALMVKLNLNIHVVIVLFGLFVSGTMLLAMRKHAANQREHDSLALIGEHKH